MNARLHIALALALGALLPGQAQAQLDVGGDLLDACARIEALVDDSDYAGALNEARQCLEGLEQQVQGQLAELFPAEVAGWTQESFEQSKAMGFSNTSATYGKGGNRVEVSLTGGSALNALSGLAAMGMMQGGKQVRVANLPATLSNDGSLLVPLEDGSLLRFESRNFSTADEALSGMGDLIDAFPVGQLNKSLKAMSE